LDDIEFNAILKLNFEKMYVIPFQPM